MKIVCIDTDILGWAIKGHSTDKDREKVKQAKSLLDYLTNNKNIKVVIPTVVLAEMLCDVKNKTEREDIVDYMENRFFLAPYNVSAAKVFSEITVEKLSQKKEELAKHRQNSGVPRSKMKNDWNICATALAHKCDTVFTNNVKDFTKFVGSHIKIESLDYVEKIESQGEFPLFSNIQDSPQ